MARLPRVYVEGAVYYISCRAAYNEKLFKDEKDYKMYLELLEKYREEYSFKLFAYVLLPEHLHLLIEPSPRIEISDIMHSLNTAYSKYFNSYYNRRGHLFRERFRACIVQKEGYLGSIIEHIHNNPIRLKLSDGAKDYPYSSVYLYNNKEDGYRYDEIKEAVSYIEQYQRNIPAEGKDKELDLRKRLHRGGILGSKEFRAKVKEEIQKDKSINKESRDKKNRIIIGISLGVIVLLAFIAGIVKYFRFKPRSVQKESGENFFIAPVAIKEIKDLNNTEWTVKFTFQGEKKSFPDTLSFVDGKFVSAWFYKDGFKPTNYSVTQSRDKIIWETIQTSGNSTVSWRGEITANKMRGIASLRSKDETRDFSFISISFRRKK